MVSGTHHAESSTGGESFSGTPHNSRAFGLGSFAIDELRPTRVVVIGAGYSGIVAGIRIPQRLQKAELVIYEKLADVGGTWSVSICIALSYSMQIFCDGLGSRTNTQ